MQVDSQVVINKLLDRVRDLEFEVAVLKAQLEAQAAPPVPVPQESE